MVMSGFEYADRRSLPDSEKKPINTRMNTTTTIKYTTGGPVMRKGTPAKSNSNAFGDTHRRVTNKTAINRSNSFDFDIFFFSMTIVNTLIEFSDA
jgi:hypothetical protein